MERDVGASFSTFPGMEQHQGEVFQFHRQTILLFVPCCAYNHCNERDNSSAAEEGEILSHPGSYSLKYCMGMGCGMLDERMRSVWKGRGGGRGKVIGNRMATESGKSTG
jgi:hypothetical protein